MYLKHRPEKYKVQSEIIKGEKNLTTMSGFLYPFLETK